MNNLLTNIMGTTTSWVDPEVNISYFTPVTTNQSEITDLDDKWMLSKTVPGLNKEEVAISVEDKVLFLEIPKSDFTVEENSEYNFDFKIKPDKIEAVLEEGVLTIVVNKPKKNKFEVSIQ